MKIGNFIIVGLGVKLVFFLRKMPFLLLFTEGVLYFQIGCQNFIFSLNAAF